MLMKILKLMWYIFNNFPIFFIDASFSSIVSSKKKKSWKKLKVGFQTGWRLWTAKPLWNYRKIQRNHGYRDTHLWRFPVDLKRVYSLGHKQGHKMFPEQDTNPTTFVLTLKSFRVSFPVPKIPAFFGMAPKRLWWASPSPSARIPSTLSFTAAPLHASFQQEQTSSGS